MFFGLLLLFVVVGAVLAAVDEIAAPNSVDVNIIRLKDGAVPTFRMIPRHLIQLSPYNPREADSFTDSDPEYRRLLDSFKRFGWMPGFPVTCIETGEANKSVRTIGGHRRLAVSAARGIDMIPCLVMPAGSLTRAEEMRMVNDHRTTAGLKPSEVLRSYRTLLNAGFTRDTIAVTLGWLAKGDKRNDNNFTKYNKILSLPEADQAIWKAYVNEGRGAKIPSPEGELDDKGAVKMVELPYIPGKKEIDALSAAIGQDASKNPTRLPQHGPAFKAARKQLLSKDTPDPIVFDKTEYKKWAQTETSRAVLRAFYYRIAGVGHREIGDFHTLMRYMHDKAFGVRDGAVAVPEPTAIMEEIFNPADTEDVPSTDPESAPATAPVKPTAPSAAPAPVVKRKK